MKRRVILRLLSVLIGGVVLLPTPVHAAGWISRSDEYAAPWVKEVEQELLKPEYRYLYASDPRTPQAVVLRILNQAAKAQEAEQSTLAQQLVREALGVFEEGVRRHYYTEDDIEPITTFIRQRAPVKTS